MSRKKSDVHESVERILELVRLYGTQKAFLQACEIQNHSYISDLKHGKIDRPSAGYLEQIVRGTGCSGTWLLTGRGEKFEPIRKNPNIAEESPAYGSFLTALSLIEKIEQQRDALKDIELPPDLELRLARLLVRLLERRNEYSDD